MTKRKGIVQKRRPVHPNVMVVTSRVSIDTRERMVRARSVNWAGFIRQAIESHLDSLDKDTRK